MAKEKIEGLLQEIAEHTIDHNCSIQQKQLLEGVERHMHDWNEPDKADPGLKEMFELLVIEFESDHPKVASALEEIIDILGKMGL